MSDFGSHVAVRRSDGRPTSEADEARVRVAARSLQFTQKDHIGPYDEFDLRVGSVRYIDGAEGISVGLTAHFLGDDKSNGGLDPEVIIAREEPVAERFAEDLAKALGDDYICDAYSGHW